MSATWNMMLTMVKTRLPRKPVSNNSSRWKCAVLPEPLPSRYGSAQRSTAQHRTACVRHIIEQIELVKKILDNGYAYESEGSVYFDVEKYNKDHNYGVLSGRNIDDMLNTTRALDGQDEKRNPIDFALLESAQPEHIMRWPSPWSDGFPGWHCEMYGYG